MMRQSAVNEHNGSKHMIRKVTKVQYNRVKRLRKAFADVPESEVDLRVWRCDTHACLAGHATNMETFQKEGFELRSQWVGGTLVTFPKFQKKTHLNACEAFFGSAELFCVRSESTYDRKILDYSRLSNKEIAIARMDLFLEENKGVLTRKPGKP